MLAKIKAAQLQARKNKNEIEKSLLTTLIGEAEMVGKDERNGAPTDEEVFKILKKFEKGLVETINLMLNSGKPVPIDTLDQYRTELSIILKFLPAKLTDLQVEKDIGVIMLNNALPKEKKSMGVVVKELKAKYGAQFDGPQVASVFSRLVA